MEAPLQQVAIGDDVDLIGGGWRDVDDSDASLESVATLQLIRSGIDEDPIQPGVEPVDVVQLREPPPASDERLLGRVFRQRRVTKDEAGYSEEAIDLEGGLCPKASSSPPSPAR